MGGEVGGREEGEGGSTLHRGPDKSDARRAPNSGLGRHSEFNSHYATLGLDRNEGSMKIVKSVEWKIEVIPPQLRSSPTLALTLPSPFSLMNSSQNPSVIKPTPFPSGPGALPYQSLLFPPPGEVSSMWLN